MGVSFTISKKGKRYTHQPSSIAECNTDEQDDNQNQNQIQGNSTSTSKTKSHDLLKSTVEQLKELGPSFSLNLFEDGFTIGDNKIFQGVPENIIPYCIDTDMILTDVECGRLPTGVLQDMQLKFVNGTVLCEVRDYRVLIEFPTVDIIALKMGLDNVIEDMSSMSENFSYSDTLKFQSTVLRFLCPHLYLDPTPMLEFGNNETTPKIDLGIDRELRKRKRRSVLTNVDSVLDRFLSVDMVTRRHAVPQRNPVEGTSFVTSGYTTTLISSHLNEMETNDI